MMTSQQKKKRYDGFERRLALLAIALVLAFSVLVLRLWDLQIVHGPEYERLAEENRLYVDRIKAPRGIIYGRDNTTVLADNRAACDIVIVPKECDDPEQTASLLQQLLGTRPERLLAALEASRNQPYQQVVVKQDVSRTDLLRVEEMAYALPGVETVVRPQRRYLYGSTAGQLLGYLSEINKDELEVMKPEYSMGDLIGRSGLEAMYEDYLRGSDGQLCVVRYASGVPQVRTDAQGVPYVSVDSFGRPLVELPERRIDPVPGRPLHVTLDMALQAEAERTLEGQVGSIVVLNAETGEVLALASVPGYDPGVFVTSGLSHQRAALLNDRTLKPMRNRSFQEVYPPGSTFKVMLACAALEEGVITRNTSFFCPGQFRLSGVSRPWRCWRKGGHGTISVVGALAYSCDVFFYNVGLKLGPEKISEWAARMGLGVRTGLDLPDEATGLIDSPQHKEARFKKLYPDDPSEWKWYPGNTVNLAIGQGAAAITPLQNAVMMAAVLNGGRRAEPYLNLERGPVLSEPFLSPQTLAIVQEGMRDCVEDVTPPSGTGKEARIEGMVVIGKTGTAQAVGAHQYAKYKNELDIPYELRDHALFVAGVMDRSPRIAVSVLIEHGLHGSSAAAPVARHMIEFFYNRNTPTGESAGPIAIAELPGDNNE